NEMYDNTIGMGLYHPAGASEPALPVMEDWKIMNNYIHDNNQFFGGVGGLPALLPPGGGILLQGVSGHSLEGNRVENNDFFGLAVIDFCVSRTGLPGPCTPDPNTTGHDPVPRNNVISDNTFVNNGTNPVSHPLAPLAADIIDAVLDPTANNCYEENTFTTFASLLGATEPQACP
ncbi:MAG: hypothetical protein GY725_10645, partial [bacterium]|nr:hypothetical protein [bacterium]